MDEQTKEVEALLTEAIANGRMNMQNVTLLCEAVECIRRLSYAVEVLQIAIDAPVAEPKASVPHA